MTAIRTTLSKAIQQAGLKMKARHQAIALSQGEKFVRRLERLIARVSLVGDAPFFDCDQFEWIVQLEANWPTIRQELDQVLERVELLPNFQDIAVDQATITQDDRWKTFFFYGYGYKAAKNCAICPQTTQLIEQIPGMKTAFFSILFPQKQIPEHHGPYKGLLRYHLALKVPEQGDCGIRVGTEVRHWQEGKSLLFDDTFPHAAWNLTDQIRVVLFVDVVRPLRFPFSLLNRAMIQLIAWSPYVQGGKENFMEWEDRLEKDKA